MSLNLFILVSQCHDLPAVTLGGLTFPFKGEFFPSLSCQPYPVILWGNTTSLRLRSGWDSRGEGLHCPPLPENRGPWNALADCLGTWDKAHIAERNPPKSWLCHVPPCQTCRSVQQAI